MTDTKQPEATPQNLYQITGNVADMNTVLIERSELHRWKAENAGLRALTLAHQRVLWQYLELKDKCAELEAQLYAVGAGGVGQSIKPSVQADTVIPVSVPTGWKLVPVEPTDDMFIEGMDADLSGRPSLDDDKHVRSIWSAMLSSAPDAPPPLAATDEPQLDGDAQLAHQQCRAVAYLARAIANAYDVRASMVAKDARLANLIGEASAAAMEWLGDELNGMDAASETDDWLNPIFDAAQQRWPGNETEAPRPPAQSCCTCTKTADLHQVPAPAQQNPVAWVWRYRDGELSELSFGSKSECECNFHDYAGKAIPLDIAHQPDRHPLMDVQIAESEREACAALADRAAAESNATYEQFISAGEVSLGLVAAGARNQAKKLAEAIRARGQQ